MLRTVSPKHGCCKLSALTLEMKLVNNVSHVRLRHAYPSHQVQNLPSDNFTSWMSKYVSDFSIDNLSQRAIHRSKRMILDSLGVGLIGSSTKIAHTLRSFADESGEFQIDKQGSTIWGVSNKKCSASMAAYLNGVSCHAMDFDDTWHPATHPSGPILPAVLAIAEQIPNNDTPSLQDILVAFNVGVQVQGMLLRCSVQAKNIPNRLHPPAIVGVMGSAAAVSRLLGHEPVKCRHALAIAASFAGAPMANAGTAAKPLHSGKSARFGLEAALLSRKGIEGNENILDLPSGFGAYYVDYDPEKVLDEFMSAEYVILHHQDIAFKRFPCHFGMHFGIEAALNVRQKLLATHNVFPIDEIKTITITAPFSKYIDRPVPKSEHEARHSFQFTACSALYDGNVMPETFSNIARNRKPIRHLLNKTIVINPADNIPSFDKMYVEVEIRTADGSVETGRCNTPYGHWRNPLSDTDVDNKFRKNAQFLDMTSRDDVIDLIRHMSETKRVSDLISLINN